MTSCLGNIQWRWAPTALISCCNSHFLNISCLSRPPLQRLSLFSLSSIHILRIESLVHALRAWDRVHFFKRARASLVVRGHPRFFVSNSFDLNCFELVAGFDLSPFRENVVHSSPRPQCLGCGKVHYLGMRCLLLNKQIKKGEHHALPSGGLLNCTLKPCMQTPAI